MLGLAYMSVMASCADLDYHEYTVYDKDYVFTDFGRTGAVVMNVVLYLMDLMICRKKTRLNATRWLRFRDSQIVRNGDGK